MSKLEYIRPQGADLATRLAEPRRFVQVLLGPRQVGKTTLALQVARAGDVPFRYSSADEPALRDADWLEVQWQLGRDLAGDHPDVGALLVLDEVQKIQRWSETVKRLWDEDTRNALPLRVLLLGSAAMIVQQGLSESLAGRFEVIPVPHWSFSEMSDAFGFSLDEYLYFGAYPGAAPLIRDEARWSQYIRTALVETTISRDVLLMTRVDKPALLRRLFELGCEYSGQILSYTKMVGQLQDAGNTTTLAHYLDLLEAAGMIAGLQKYSGGSVRRRASSPKLQVLNTALMTATSGLTFAEARADRSFRGRMVESAVGAHLYAGCAGTARRLCYWRERGREVDFVVESGKDLLVVEVKTGAAAADKHSGLAAFSAAFRPKRKLLVGGDGVDLDEFLRRDVDFWFG